MSDKKLSDLMLEQGDDFPIDSMDDYGDRIDSGEFAGKTDAEIRTIYFNEVVRSEEDDELDAHYREMDAQEEAEDD